MNLIEAILSKDFLEANDIIESKFLNLKEKQLVELKKQLVAEMFGEEIEYGDDTEINEARFRIIRARIRRGKIQRRKKVSTNKNYTFRKVGHGPAKLVRITATEHRHRRLGARRGKMKRRAKKARILQKRRRSLQKRKALGL